MTTQQDTELSADSGDGKDALDGIRDRARRQDGGEFVQGDLEKFLTFVLHGEEYGIGILKVREIMGYMEETPVPQTPDFVRGVINLRGEVIPVIDLRSKFEMPEVEITDETCIIVVEVQQGEDSVVQMGIVVDSVEEVRDIHDDDIDPTPSFGEGIDNEYIEGMGKNDDRVIILLDIDRVLSDEELVELQGAGNEPMDDGDDNADET